MEPEETRLQVMIHLVEDFVFAGGVVALAAYIIPDSWML